MSTRSREYDWLNLALDDDTVVRIYPKGGLKLVRFSGLYSWTSIVPGILGIVGLIANKLIFRGAWVVRLRPSGDVDTVDPDEARFVVRDRAEAERCVEAAREWLRSHQSLAGFSPIERPRSA